MSAGRYGISLLVFNLISTSSYVLFCLLYKRANDDFLTIFRRFPNTFRRFLKILQKFSEGQTVVSEYLRKFLKIAQDSRSNGGFPRKNGWCFNRTGTHLSTFYTRDYVTIVMVIFSLLKITCYFHM